MRLYVSASAVVVLLLVHAAAARAAGAGDDSLAAGQPRWWGASSGNATVPFPYIYEPIGSWVYDEVDREVAQGNLTGIAENSRPLPRSLIAARVAQAFRDGKHSVGLDRLARELAWEGRMMGLHFPYEDSRPMATVGPPSSFAKFNGRLAAGGTFVRDLRPDFEYQSLAALSGDYWHPSGLSMHGEYVVTQIPNASLYGDPVAKNTEIEYWTPRYTVAWHGGVFEVWAGRDNIRFGPGRSGGLLAGGGTRNYAQLGYRVHLGTFVTATAVHGWLSQPEGRYVAYHRVEMNLGKGFRLGLGEGVRYDGTAPNLLYLTNLVTYAAVERLDTADMNNLDNRDKLVRSNVLAAADLYWRWGPGRTVYGELLVDDVKSGGQAPARMGFQVGTSYIREGARRLSLQAEYTRVYNYTYAVYYGRDFFHRGFDRSEQSLGYPLGADVGNLNLWADLDLDLNWTLTGRLRRTQIGEGNGAGAWCPQELETDNPFGTVCQSYGPISGSDFAGTVERTVQVTGGGAFSPRDNLRFELEAGVVFVHNLDHEEGRTASRPTLRTLASWRW